MFKDLLKKERQKLWLAAALSATEVRAVERRASRPHTNVGTIESDAVGSDLGEHSLWGGPQHVLAIARTASGL
jgi:hypothetical protein